MEPVSLGCQALEAWLGLVRSETPQGLQQEKDVVRTQSECVWAPQKADQSREIGSC